MKIKFGTVRVVVVRYNSRTVRNQKSLGHSIQKKRRDRVARKEKNRTHNEVGRVSGQN